jgi:hypothetical protein
MGNDNTAPTAQFPGNAIDKTATDIVKPLGSVLQGLDLVTDPAEGQPKSGIFGEITQTSGAALESSATSFAKWCATLVTSLGGATTIGTGIAAIWGHQKGSVQVAIVAALGAVLAVTLLGVAWIVAADLKARATGQAAIYHARRDIAISFLEQSYTATSTEKTTVGADAERAIREKEADARTAQANATAKAADVAKATLAAAQVVSNGDAAVFPHLLSPAAAVLALAAAGKQALVKDRDGVEGHLAGISQSDGALRVGFKVGDKSTPVDPQSLTIISFTY